MLDYFLDLWERFRINLIEIFLIGIGLLVSLIILVFLLLLLLLFIRLCIYCSSHFIYELFLVLKLCIKLFNLKSKFLVFFCLFINNMLKRCVLIFKLQIFVPKLLNLFLRLYPTFNDLNYWYLVLSLYLICLLVRSTYLALSCFNFFYFLLLFLSYYSCLSLFSFFRLCKLKILWFKHFSLLRRFITFSQP